jgi:hypothetical protein
MNISKIPPPQHTSSSLPQIRRFSSHLYVVLFQMLKNHPEERIDVVQILKSDFYKEAVNKKMEKSVEKFIENIGVKANRERREAMLHLNPKELDGFGDLRKQSSLQGLKASTGMSDAELKSEKSSVQGLKASTGMSDVELKSEEL